MPLMEIITQCATAVRFTAHRFRRRPVFHRRRGCRVILKTSCSLTYIAVGVLFLLGVCLLNLLHTKRLPAPGGDTGAVTTVLIWTHPFGNYRTLPDCKVRYRFRGCTLTDDRRALPNADAVIIHHREIWTNLSLLPLDSRPPGQKWIWMNFESPSHTRGLSELEGLFNLTMSYRADSDIFLPYGYLVPRHNSVYDFPLPVHSYQHLKPFLLAWVISNWSESHARVAFYRQLSRYVHVDVFGQAGLPLPDDSGVNSVVQVVKQYQFYLSLENSQHTDYITEKVWNALLAGAIPVVLGPTRENYERFLPPKAFIHADDFPSVRRLAQYLLLLRRNPVYLQRHLAWRRSYSVHKPAFWGEHYCTACRAVRKARGRTDTVTDLEGWFRS